MALTGRQQRILEIIKESIESRGYPPTVRELCDLADISSTSVVNYHLKRLAEKGYLERNPEISRGIKLLGPAQNTLNGQISVPFVGRIAAGSPLPIPDSDFNPYNGECLSISPELLPEQENLFALEVRGNSMIDALIGDGDLVIIKHQTQVENGEMAAVWLKEKRETTLKNFYLEGSQARLQPANPYMDPIYVDAEDVEIQGTVVLVIRRPQHIPLRKSQKA